MEEITTLTNHEDRVWHVCWSPTGNMLASCGGDKVIRIWVPTNQENLNLGWHLSATLEEMQTGTIRSCEFSPCGNFLSSCSFDSTIAIWKLSDGEWECVNTLEGHDNEVKSSSWNADGSMLATCSRDKSVWIWSTSGVAAGGMDVHDVDGDDEEWACLAVLNGHTQDVKFVKWHPEKSILFSCSYDDTIKVWTDDLDDWLCVDTLKGHTSTVWSLAVNEAGDKLASCSQDCTIRVWHKLEAGNWICGQVIKGVHDQTIFSIDWVGSLLIAGCGDNSISVYKWGPIEKNDDNKVDEGFTLVFKQEGAHDQDVNCVRLHPKHSGLLASASDASDIKLWNVK